MFKVLWVQSFTSILRVFTDWARFRRGEWTYKCRLLVRQQHFEQNNAFFVVDLFVFDGFWRLKDPLADKYPHNGSKLIR